MSLMRLRLVLTAAIAAAICLAVSARPDAAANVNPFERLVARALDPSDRSAASSPIDIVIERWSTEAESERINNTLMQGGADKLANLIAIIQHTRVRAGVMEVPGIQSSGSRVRSRGSHIVKFARQITTPSGRQVIVVINEAVAVGKHVELADLRAMKGPSKPEITLIDIRFGADGTGIGKLAVASTVAYNATTETIELANYDKEPVRLIEVKSEKFNGGFARLTGR